MTFKTANQLVREGKLEEAIASYQEAIEESPRFYWSKHNLAEILSKQGKYEEAIDLYKQAIELNPNEVSCYHKMGDALTKIDRIEDAIFVYHQAINFNPSYPGPYRKFGELLHKLALEFSSELSKESYPKVWKILAEENRSNFALTRELYKTNDDSFLENTANLSDEEFICHAYQTYLLREADEEGKNTYLQTLNRISNRKEILLALRNSEEFKQKYSLSLSTACLRKAILAYYNARKINPSWLQKQLTKALNQLGQKLTQLNQLDEAIETYREAIALDNESAEIFYRQGNLFAEKGQQKLAIEAYKQAIAINPRYTDAYLNLIEILTKLDKTEEAATWLQTVITYLQTKNKKIELEFQLGNILVKQGKLNEAQVILESAMDLKDFSLGQTWNKKTKQNLVGSKTMDQRSQILSTRILPVQPVFREYFEGDSEALFLQLWNAINDSCNLQLPIEDFQIEESSQNSIEELASNPILLKLLQTLVLLKQPKQLLEIGTFIGISALYMASVMPSDGQLTTIEKYDRFCQIARKNFLNNGLEQKIKLLEGDAFTQIEELIENNQIFDMVFLDGNKEKYLDYFRKIDPLVPPGGLFVVDDVFFHGDALNQTQKTEKGKGVRNFLEYIKENSQYHKIILPIHNGVMLMFKKEVV